MSYDTLDVKIVPTPITVATQEGLFGRRILVLGESHYHCCYCDVNCPEDQHERAAYHRNLTTKVVSDWTYGPHRSSLSHKVPKVFGIDEKKKFWPYVIFYNYVQTFAGPKARKRPDKKQWEDTENHRCFQDVLNATSPTRILVLGKQTWQNLPGSGSTKLYREPTPELALHVSPLLGIDNCDKTGYWYHYPNGSALAMPIKHPASIGFKASDWQQVVSDWLAFSK